MSGIDDGVKTKVLHGLMQAMVHLHGASAPKQLHESNAVLPNPDGSQKHDPAGKIQGEGVMPGKSVHMNLEHESLGGQGPDMNEHGGEGEEPSEHSLGDLFGRKKPEHAEYF